MSALTVLEILSAIGCNVSATLLLRRFVTASGVSLSDLSLSALPQLVVPVIALAFYGAAFVLYALVLRVLPVSRAYALITFGAQVVLAIIGVAFLGERLRLTDVFGMALVLGGLTMLALNAAEATQG
jgi:small multidrug resistance pump